MLVAVAHVQMALVIGPSEAKVVVAEVVMAETTMLHLMVVVAVVLVPPAQVEIVAEMDSKVL